MSNTQTDETALTRTLTLQTSRLKLLADQMEEEGNCLQILGRVGIEGAFGKGSEMKGAADMVREWADHLTKTYLQKKMP